MITWRNLFRSSCWHPILLLGVSVCAACASSGGGTDGGTDDQQTFATPEAAALALVDALRAEDRTQLDSILGASGKDLYDSGDEVADRENRRRFVEAYAKQNRIERHGTDEAVIRVGEVDWPLPIPIVQADGKWIFDTEGARRWILDLRVGRNELEAFQVCLAFVDAQRDYALEDRDDDGILEYAQKAWSSPGKKDGLYWEAADGEPQSPLGPLAATAAAQGYQTGGTKAEGLTPYRGYFYRLLTAQGAHAQGGAGNYLEDGNMVNGFALVAWPAEYGVSGIKTYTVNHDGTVFEKDLGDETEQLAAGMKVFDPDPTWKRASHESPAR
jgi:hypothetical protein